jgi:hypothetical protein
MHLPIPVRESLLNPWSSLRACLGNGSFDMLTYPKTEYFDIFTYPKQGNLRFNPALVAYYVYLPLTVRLVHDRGRQHPALCQRDPPPALKAYLLMLIRIYNYDDGEGRMLALHY